jgi:DNA-binding NtrC family response regulator/tetratricopeptide (TPR) repeat protein
MRGTMDYLCEMVGESPGIVAVREQLRRLLARETGGRRLPPLLIRGETGTGKGLLARAIHRASAHAGGPFVDINCAAIPEPLLEAELFGYERGAFTDARQAKPGLFQTAHGGTLFLDEVGHLPQPLQAKLLTAIEERTVRRLGSTRSEPAEAWIVAATSVDLEAAMRAQRFLEALYHRLSVLVVALPPLRERGGDIVLLAESFLARACADYALPSMTLSSDARAALCAYPWPGNVRELSNLIERAALLADERVVTGAILGLGVPAAADLSEPSPASAEEPDPFRASLGRFERVRLLEALGRTGWNVSRAADLLGIPRNTLRYRIAKHGLQPAAAALETESPERPRAMDGEAEPEGEPAERPAPVEGETRAITFLRVAIATLEAPAPPSPAGRVLERLAQTVEGFGGHVLSLGPGGLVAAFGLLPLEETPARAAHAALAIRRATEADAEFGVPGVAVALALHGGAFPTRRTGRAVPEVAGDAAIDADTVLATLVARTPAGAILVTRETAALLERRFELEAWRGLEGVPGSVYRLVGRERTGYGLGGRVLSRFVGRERELELVADLLGRARAGRGQLLGIVGEPGVGKSRLIYEFTRPYRVPDWLVLQGAAVPHGTATAYLLVLELLRRYFRIEDRDSALVIRDKVAGTLSSLGERPGDTAVPLQSLLGALPPDDPFRSFDRRRRQRRALDALKRLVLWESQRQPVLLVLEDVQWIDPESQVALDFMAESLPTASVLLVMSYRPEYQHAFAGRSYYTQLRVDPLGAESAQELLEALLGTDATLARLRRRLIERTGGNPFFLEESVRSLVDAAILVGSPGGYRAVEDVERIEVPGSLRVLLAARIDRLPPEAKRLLQSAAVIGTTVPQALLQAIVEEPDERLRHQLARLRAAEFLYETAALPDEEYTFAHELTHEVAYESLLPDARRDLHARIVLALERLDPGRTVFALERLAHHAWKGEVWDRAVRYLRQAGVRALARSSFHEARTYCERALAALAHLPDSPATRAQEVDIRLDLGEALTPLGQHSLALDCLRQATALAETSNDRARLARILASMGQALRLTHANEGAVETGRRALAVAADAGDRALEAEAACHLGQACLVVGDCREAVQLLGRCAIEPDEMAAVEGGRHAPDRVISRAWLAIALAHLGRFVEGIAEGETAVRVAESEDRPHGLIAAHAALGAVCLERGDCFRAILLLERALALSSAWSLFEWASGVASSLGYAYILAGRAAEALRLLADDVAAEEPIGALGGEARRLAYRGAGRLATGDRHEALADARRALEVAMTRRERGNEAWALQLLGDLAAGEELPNVETADLRYREARALADERGMRPLVARCHLGLGALYGRAGAPARARDHLTTAVAMFRDMDMRLWLERADAERDALG